MAGVKKKRTKVLIYIVGILLLLGAIGFAVWSYIDLRRDNQQLKDSLNQTSEELTVLKEELVSNPNAAVERTQQERTNSILEQVGKLYELPQDETPTIATVQDIEQLKDQPFFENAQNGDQLIVFDESSLAILYRPSENRLVKVGPINIEGDAEQATQPSAE